ncbi:carbohydrate ABC transporter permease [Actinomyces minihominis]|uniref:carbohydrate ABC transporter permease n=1 Tax=Actinomyces minihominis TaxID=2002838 RepID=UPI000C069BEB|nr:carbohydrate ABC transporter permease [Actinomyces minihominis]
MSAIDPTPLATPEVLIEDAPARKRGRRRIRHLNRPPWWIYGILSAVILAFMFPFYWSFLIGSKDSHAIYDPNMSWLPGGNFLENAASIISDPSVQFWRALWNSLYSSALIAVSVVFFSTLAGWAFAKLRFKGSRVLLIFTIGTMAVPAQLGVVPLYLLFAEIGWTGRMGAVIVPAMTSAFGVFWMTQYLQQTVPDELVEAARVDGASSFRTFLSVGIPAARPAAAMLGLFTFVSSWNNFFWPFIILDKQNPTLPVALSLLQSAHFKDYSLVLTGVFLSTLPLLVLFIFAGKQLVSGIMQGAVKG